LRERSSRRLSADRVRAGRSARSVGSGRDDDDNAQIGEKPLPVAMMMMRGEFP
jgi:hypothetical protein